MKRIIFFLFLFVLSIVSGSAEAQNIKKYYTSHMAADGMIYHLFSQNLFAHEKYGDLSSDITYKTDGDAKAIFNFTYHTPDVMRADSISLVGARCRVSISVAPIYIERGKNNWDHRYTCRIPLSDLQRFFASATGTEVWIWAKGSRVVYHVRPAEWKQYASPAGMIFRTIRLNEKQNSD